MFGASKSVASVPILVSAITDQFEQIVCLRKNCVDAAAVLIIKHELEDAAIVLRVLRDAEPATDDHTGDGRAIQNRTHGHIGDARGVLFGNVFEDGEQFLEQRPVATARDSL